PALAPAPVPAPPLTVPPASAAGPVTWKDGTYSGWGTSRHGDVEATVIIEKGRITAAAISRCLTRYSCSWIAHLQPQVVERQSPEVDNVSGATESANAFYYAVVEALKAARQ
ncbi:FMN-binding protein, partial [Gemmatimonas sp.]